MLQIKMINKYNNKVKINLVITGLYFLDSSWSELFGHFALKKDFDYSELGQNLS